MDLTVRIERTDATLSLHCEKAHTAMRRLIGLLTKRYLAEDASLLITPCNSIHTWFMRFPIDVVFLDRQFTILQISDSVPPFRVRFGKKGAHSVLELAAGRARRVGLMIGDRLTFSQA